MGVIDPGRLPVPVPVRVGRHLGGRYLDPEEGLGLGPVFSLPCVFERDPETQS